jgi:hypothetical protein
MAVVPDVSEISLSPPSEVNVLFTCYIYTQGKLSGGPEQMTLGTGDTVDLFPPSGRHLLSWIQQTALANGCN